MANNPVEARPTVTAPVGQSYPHHQTIIYRRHDIRLKFVIFFLLVVIAYMVFSIASMVPQARSHFIDVLLNPSLDFFLMM